MKERLNFTRADSDLTSLPVPAKAVLVFVVVGVEVAIIRCSQIRAPTRLLGFGAKNRNCQSQQPGRYVEHQEHGQDEQQNDDEDPDKFDGRPDRTDHDF